MGRRGGAGLALALVVAAAGCGGGSDGDGLAGTWSHPDLGSIELDGEGGATFDIPVDPEAGTATYEQVEGEDWDLAFTDEGSQLEAEVDGDEMTFYPGTWGNDDEVTFTRG